MLLPPEDTSTLPPPPVPPDLDVRKLEYMPLHVGKLRDSAFGAKVSAEAFRAGIMLWCAAWHQVPAGSLPNDLDELAALAGYGRIVSGGEDYLSNVVAPIIADALHNFFLHSDGKLYHDFIVERALEAGEKHERFSAAARKRWKEKKKLKDATHHATHVRGICKGKGKCKGKSSIDTDDDDDDEEASQRDGSEGQTGGPPLKLSTILDQHPDARAPFEATAPRVRDLVGNPTLPMARVALWIASGADPDLDIVPAIEATLARANGTAINSLRYFDRPIAEWHADRTTPTPPRTTTTTRNRHGRQNAAQSRADAFIAALHDRINHRPA